MRNSYSQNGEDLIILEYVNNHPEIMFGNVVEFGANNGTDLSNSRLLIENDFGALLIEPSSAFNELSALHKNNNLVYCLNVAVGSENGEIAFYESGAHVVNGKDRCLVSTTDINEIKRWPNVEFTKKTVPVQTVPEIQKISPGGWHVISIDIEGLDWIVLQQIDLSSVDCHVLCIEHNGSIGLARKFTQYCAKFGMKEIHRNGENLIFAK